MIIKGNLVGPTKQIIINERKKSIQNSSGEPNIKFKYMGVGLPEHWHRWG
jgi:hypothetical protein